MKRISIAVAVLFMACALRAAVAQDAGVLPELDKKVLADVAALVGDAAAGKKEAKAALLAMGEKALPYLEEVAVSAPEGLRTSVREMLRTVLWDQIPGWKNLAKDLRELFEDRAEATAVMRVLQKLPDPEEGVGPQKAERLLSLALRYTDDVLMADTALGVMQRVGMTDEMVRALRHRSIGRKDPWASEQLGIYYEKKGMAQEAFDAYNHALKVDPACRTAAKFLAWWHFREKDFEKAIPYFRIVLAGDMKSTFDYQAMAASLAATGKPREAQKIWADFAGGQETPAAWWLAVRFYRSVGLDSLAVEAAEEYLKRYGEDPVPMLSEAADASLGAGKYAKYFEFVGGLLKASADEDAKRLRRGEALAAFAKAGGASAATAEELLAAAAALKGELHRGALSAVANLWPESAQAKQARRELEKKE